MIPVRLGAPAWMFFLHVAGSGPDGARRLDRPAAAMPWTRRPDEWDSVTTRLCPSQDPAPGPAIGNLIAAPPRLFKPAAARRDHFLPEGSRTAQGPWLYLSTSDVMTTAEVNALPNGPGGVPRVAAEVNQARRSVLIANTAGPLHQSCNVRLGAGSPVEQTDSPRPIASALRHAPAMHNPEF